MHRGLPESSENVSQQSTSRFPDSPSHHGFHHDHRNDVFSGSRSQSPSPPSAAADGGVRSDEVDASQLDARLRRLSGQVERPEGSSKAPTPGQRVSDYERAMTPSTPKRSLGFRVIKRSGSPTGGIELNDFPNEILTHILSHLPPDSHTKIALVSKRFYQLVTTPHAWRMAFIRYFPGQDVLIGSASGDLQGSPQEASSTDVVRSEVRSFTRLTSVASWRSEYLLRTRLLRSVARGKPNTSSGGIGAAVRSSHLGKKSSAVLTYNSKLPWTVSHLHAVFSGGSKKAPRVIHGSSEYCCGTLSDPTSGKIDRWGLDDPFAFAQLDEVFPQLEQYGLGDGPAAVPNVMDVSRQYGVLGGEGFPGGRAFFRSTSMPRGRYLGAQENSIVEQNSDLPKVPELSEAVCAVWIAKSAHVPSQTQSMVGMMTGSSLGIVTAYALGNDTSTQKYANGDMTARWVLCPGVPIIAIKVDDSYSSRRKSMGRIWAAVLNALGEVYYLKDAPKPATTQMKAENPTKAAWYTGRTAYWDLVEPTRRTAQPDEFDKNAVRGAYSPRSSSHAMKLSNGQLVAEAREIEKFLKYKPDHFRRACEGWDMRQRLEVDFAAGDDAGAGESIFVIRCGYDEDAPAQVRRYTRCIHDDTGSSGLSSSPSNLVGGYSIFGSSHVSPFSPSGAAASSPAAPSTPGGFPSLKSRPPGASTLEGWRVTVLSMDNHNSTEITASAIDQTWFALLCPFEDSLHMTAPEPDGDEVYTPGSKLSGGEIPGRRARLLAIGTKGGAVVVWNMRDASVDEVQPLRVIQTDSPEVSCLALSALYILHGGSDGLVQAWDPLASTLEPVRTLNSRSSGRANRHIIRNNPALANANFAAVGAIFLDPDPTVLRGVLSFGTFLRYWSYSSTAQTSNKKRRTRHSDIHGRLGARRQGGTVMGYIEAETAELRQEQESRSREQARLRSRFGVGLGDLTEEEAVRYALLMSEEAFLEDELRRTSDAGSTGDGGETASSFGSASVETITPEPSVAELSPPAGPSSSRPSPQEDTDDDYELQIQRAIRLSLMEGVNDLGQSPRDSGSGEYEFQVKYKAKKDRGRRSASSSPTLSQSHTPLVQHAEPSSSSKPGIDPVQEDFELALRLSLEEVQDQEQDQGWQAPGGVGLGLQEQEFPALEAPGKGRGKGKQL